MAYQYLPRYPPITNEQQLLCSASLSEKDVERFYGDFLDHSFPGTTMSQHSFKVYMTKYGLRYTDDRLWALFRAFNFNNNGVITFPELLMGLACVDNKSIHNETRAKVRHDFIFYRKTIFIFWFKQFIVRYYDVYRQGYLTEDVMRLMIQEMNIGKDITDEMVEAKLAEMLQEVETEEDPDNPGKVLIYQRPFLAGIGSHKIRGTSKLCRIGKPICTAIASAIFARKQRNKKSNRALANVIDRQNTGSCVGCRGKRPNLDEHLAKINAEGYLIEHVSVAVLQASLSQESSTIMRTNSCKSTKSSKSRKSTKSSCTSLHTISYSSVEGIAVQDPIALTGFPGDNNALATAKNLVHLIREFAPNKGNTTNPLGLMATNDQDRRWFVEQMELIERALTPVLKTRRWVPVPSPAYIVGDIHGNLDDLLTLEKSLWKRFPFIGPNVIFLGDMVDRGKWSVECATYLLCLSVIAPHKVMLASIKCVPMIANFELTLQVILLRGNHEVRSLQCHYTYWNECTSKYCEFGPKIFEITNRLFDLLPVNYQCFNCSRI